MVLGTGPLKLFMTDSMVVLILVVVLLGREMVLSLVVAVLLLKKTIFLRATVVVVRLPVNWVLLGALQLSSKRSHKIVVIAIVVLRLVAIVEEALLAVVVILELGGLSKVFFVVVLVAVLAVIFVFSSGADVPSEVVFEVTEFLAPHRLFLLLLFVFLRLFVLLRFLRWGGGLVLIVLLISVSHSLQVGFFSLGRGHLGGKPSVNLLFCVFRRFLGSLSLRFLWPVQDGELATLVLHILNVFRHCFVLDFATFGAWVDNAEDIIFFIAAEALLIHPSVDVVALVAHSHSATHASVLGQILLLLPVSFHCSLLHVRVHVLTLWEANL